MEFGTRDLNHVMGAWRGGGGGAGSSDSDSNHPYLPCCVCHHEDFLTHLLPILVSISLVWKAPVL